jgi:hypothetical protein
MERTGLCLQSTIKFDPGRDDEYGKDMRKGGNACVHLRIGVWKELKGIL